MGRIVESAAERLALPGELAGMAKLTMTGDGHLLVENHRGLLEYSDDIIRLSGGRLRYLVRGRGLHLLAMDGCSLVIRGKIYSVELE